MQKSRKTTAWNRGKAVGKMRPFTEKQVQLIRDALTAKGPVAHLALFETALSTALRASDLLKLHVRDVLGSDGNVIDRLWVRQKKTSKPVCVDLTDKARTALRDYIHQDHTSGLHPDELLWKFGRLRYSQIIKGWAEYAHADPRLYSTHSMRRTLPAHIHAKTGTPAHAQRILGHSSLAHTAAYLGIEDAEVRDVKKLYEM